MNILIQMVFFLSKGAPTTSTAAPPPTEPTPAPAYTEPPITKRMYVVNFKDKRFKWRLLPYPKKCSNLPLPIKSICIMELQMRIIKHTHISNHGGTQSYRQYP